MKFAPHHSALHPEQSRWTCDRFEHKGSIAFVHDVVVSRGRLPREYAPCDVIYTEMAWRPGYARFLDRAQAPASTFAQYLTSLNTVVSGLTIPVCVVTGKSLVRYFPQPTQRLDIFFPDTLHKKGQCVALVYRMTITHAVRETLDVLTEIAGRFNCVGDPCCGYGNTGRAFAEAGRRFVLSDFNARCIGWIAQHASLWYQP